MKNIKQHIQGTILEEVQDEVKAAQEVIEVKLSDIKWVYTVVKSHLWIGICKTYQEAIEMEFPPGPGMEPYDIELKAQVLAYCQNRI